jgi:hypothetical protein
VNLTPWSRRVDAEPLKLPKFAKRINTRLKDLLTQHAIDGPVCHVGSLINRDDATPDDARKWRTNFSSLANNEFVGIDIFPGVNVDVVADLCAPDLFERHARFKGYFGLIFASALVEHVKEPHLLAHNLIGMLRPGGHMYFAGPWVWGYHPYPDDYWRISISGFEVLFPELVVRQWWYSGTVSNIGIEVTDRKLERKLFAQNAITGAAALITDRGMPYLNVCLIAQKP